MVLNGFYVCVWFGLSGGTRLNRDGTSTFSAHQCAGVQEVIGFRPPPRCHLQVLVVRVPAVALGRTAMAPSCAAYFLAACAALTCLSTPRFADFCRRRRRGGEGRGGVLWSANCRPCQSGECNGAASMGGQRVGLPAPTRRPRPWLSAGPRTSGGARSEVIRAI